MAGASALLLLLSFAGPAQATGTLDRQVPDGGVIPQSLQYFQMQQMAETFTPSVTGQMDRVSLYIGSGNPSLPRFRLDVYAVDPGNGSLTPVGTTASYQFQLAKTLRDWQALDLSPAVNVQAGTQYALVVTAVSFPLVLRWYYMTLWPYAGSNMWIGSPLLKDMEERNFAFRTYVTGTPTPSPSPATNNPPVLGLPATGAIEVAEGSAPTNTGAFRDPDGDSVSLTASTGSLTRTGTASEGSWTWTGAANDEDVPVQTVTVTADDGHGHTATQSFTVHVFAVQPAVTITPTGATSAMLAATTAPKEGTPLTFAGSAHSPVTADNAAGFNYAWSVTKDGAAYPAAGSAASFSFTPDDEGSFVITLSATDDGHSTGSSSLTVRVDDVPPTATITSIVPALNTPKIILPYELVTFSGTFSDPGTGDQHTATWRFGDGTSAPGWSVSHYYTSTGTYPVTLEVAQGDDPEVGTATTMVTVMTPAQALSAIGGYVQTLPGLNNGEKNSLIAKLNAASDSIARGNTTAATNQLNAFLNELAADEQTGKVTSDQVAHLEDDLRAVKGALGNYNRLLDFWPLGL
jgi:PKD domain